MERPESYPLRGTSKRCRALLHLLPLILVLGFDAVQLLDLVHQVLVLLGDLVLHLAYLPPQAIRSLIAYKNHTEPHPYLHVLVLPFQLLDLLLLRRLVGFAFRHLLLQPLVFSLYLVVLEGVRLQSKQLVHLFAIDPAPTAVSARARTPASIPGPSAGGRLGALRFASPGCSSPLRTLASPAVSPAEN